VIAAEKNQKLAEAGRKGGLARHQHLTPEQRTEIMRAVAAGRWGNMGYDPYAIVARAAQQMFVQISTNCIQQRLYYRERDRRAWHAPTGNPGESHWMPEYWIGNYGPGGAIVDAMEDFMDVYRGT